MGNEADAARCAFAKSAWRGMRDAALLANAREVIRVAGTLLAGANAAAAAECGITAASVAACTKEADDYEAVISAPQQAIAGRKATTGQLRDRFNAVEAVFASLDGLVEQVCRPNLRRQLLRRPHRAGPRPWSRRGHAACASSMRGRRAAPANPRFLAKRHALLLLIVQFLIRRVFGWQQ